MRNTDNAKKRYVWSPENGGCITEQRFVDGMFRDWNSQEEGMYPLFTNKVKQVVKWYNLLAKHQEQKQKAHEAHEAYLKIEAKAFKTDQKMRELSEKIRKM